MTPCWVQMRVGGTTMRLQGGADPADPYGCLYVGWWGDTAMGLTPKSLGVGLEGVQKTPKVGVGAKQ